MANKNKISSVVFSVYILLSFYVFGGGIVNSLVAYRTWRAVGANEFPKFHEIDSSLIIPLFVAARLKAQSYIPAELNLAIKASLPKVALKLFIPAPGLRSTVPEKTPPR